MGEAFYYQNNYPEALKTFEITLAISEDIRDKRGIAHAYQQIALTYMVLGNSPEVVRNLFLALKFYEEIGFKPGIASSFQFIAGAYQKKNDYDNVLKYYFSALKIWEEIGNKAGVSQALNSIGICYREQGKYSEALQRHFAALKISEELGDKGPNWGIAFCYASIASVYLDEGEAAEKVDKEETAQLFSKNALKNQLLSLKLFEKANMKAAIGSSNRDVGILYARLKEFKTARKYLEKALLISTEAKSIFDISSSNLELSRLDSIQGNYLQAYIHYKKYIIYRDTLSDEEQIKKSRTAKNAI